MNSKKGDKFGIQEDLQRDRFKDKMLLFSNVPEGTTLTLQDLVDFLNKKHIDLSRVELGKGFNIFIKKLEKEKVITKRLHISVDGIMQRIGWVAEFRPEILLRIVCMTHSYASNREITKPAIFSAFAKLGLRRKELHRLIEEHPEWRINVRVFDQM